MKRLWMLLLLMFSLPLIAPGWTMGGADPSVLDRTDSGGNGGQGIEGRHQKDSIIQLSPIPPVQPQTQPAGAEPGIHASASVDNPANTPPGVRFEPYNLFPRELNLWNLEGQRFVRSQPVLSPDRSTMAYTEVVFFPATRQTMTRLYAVSVPPMQAPQTHLPSEEALYPQQAPDPARSFDAFDPDKTLKTRTLLLGNGFEKLKQYEFRTFTIVDWSSSGRRLLFKQRSGILHLGLRTSDILFYDTAQGSVSVYPEVHRVIRYYWETTGNLPHVEHLSWDIQPLGWEPGSDNAILLKAWAYDKSEKKFLGLWRYNVEAERTELLTLDDTAPPVVAANGWLPSRVPIPPSATGSNQKKDSLWHRMFGYGKNKPSTSAAQQEP